MNVDKSATMVILSAINSRARWAARWLRSLRGQDDDERGQGMVEYALILVLISIVVILILTTVGKQVKNVFSNISNGLAS